MVQETGGSLICFSHLMISSSYYAVPSSHFQHHLSNVKGKTPNVMYKLKFHPNYGERKQITLKSKAIMIKPNYAAQDLVTKVKH